MAENREVVNPLMAQLSGNKLLVGLFRYKRFSDMQFSEVITLNCHMTVAAVKGLISAARYRLR